MECICNKSPKTRVAIYLPLTQDEVEKFKDFLRLTGRKAAPWVKALVLEAMEQAEESPKVKARVQAALAANAAGAAEEKV